jgi:hypothetical protein
VVKEGTLRVQATNCASSFEVTTDGNGVVGHAGAALLRELADRLGLTTALDWHQVGGRRRHPDAAVLRDLAVLLADGGDCLSDLAVLRDQPALFGPVASTPTTWRVIERVGQDPDGLARLRAARAHARALAAGGDPDVELLIIDADATLVLAQTDAKEGAAGTYKHTFGFAPLLAYLDRGQVPGEPLAGLLRPGNASPGAAGDLMELVDLALAQLPADERPVLVRSDSADGSTRLAWHLRERGIGFTLGMSIDAHVREAILAQPDPAWTSAVEPSGLLRSGAEVCQRARVEDRIRAAKATGLANLPFDLLRRNAVWLELVLAAQDLTCWTQALLLNGALAVAEPQDAALPAAACGRPDRPSRPPPDPAAASLLAVGRRARLCVRSAAALPLRC